MERKYECVIDTSAISWMERIGRLGLLTQIYENIYAPPSVFRELEPHLLTKDFVRENIEQIPRDKDKIDQLEKLVKRWRKKVNLRDLTDIEVFIAYKLLSNVNEVLYANKGAEDAFSKYLEGNEKIRDIYQLYELAEEKGIFTRRDSIEYLEIFLSIKPKYRPDLIPKLIKRLR